MSSIVGRWEGFTCSIAWWLNLFTRLPSNLWFVCLPAVADRERFAQSRAPPDLEPPVDGFVLRFAFYTHSSIGESDMFTSCRPSRERQSSQNTSKRVLMSACGLRAHLEAAEDRSRADTQQAPGGGARP